MAKSKQGDLSAHGGFRVGAGRPTGSGRYRESTKAIRVPVSLVEELQLFLSAYVQKADHKLKSEEITLLEPINEQHHALPLYINKIAAGFPSPAEDYIEGKLDLNQHLIKHPAATFYVRVAGDSMIGAGIHPNDILVVDKAINPINGKIVIAVINGELTVKRLHLKEGEVTLFPENNLYEPIKVKEGSEFQIWGVVTTVIHPV